MKVDAGDTESPGCTPSSKMNVRPVERRRNELRSRSARSPPRPRTARSVTRSVAALWAPAVAVWVHIAATAATAASSAAPGRRRVSPAGIDPPMARIPPIRGAGAAPPYGGPGQPVIKTSEGDRTQRPSTSRPRATSACTSCSFAGDRVASPAEVPVEEADHAPLVLARAGVDPADVARLGDLPERRRVARGTGVVAVELLAVIAVGRGDQEQRALGRARRRPRAPGAPTRSRTRPPRRSSRPRSSCRGRGSARPRPARPCPRGSTVRRRHRRRRRPAPRSPTRSRSSSRRPPKGRSRRCGRARRRGGAPARRPRP